MRAAVCRLKLDFRFHWSAWLGSHGVRRHPTRRASRSSLGSLLVRAGRCGRACPPARPCLLQRASLGPYGVQQLPPIARLPHAPGKESATGGFVPLGRFGSLHSLQDIAWARAGAAFSPLLVGTRSGTQAWDWGAPTRSPGASYHSLLCQALPGPSFANSGCAA